ncbi:GSCFA domain-containing protein [Kordiimonas sp. SCSIO 12603]|uniref:GSCFA domain-containing protein n=1 Tax=Kordiimonas sp. SCSIO 12603 TaxID=2829596 RepID=UPI0021071A0C|nr:GSCFA domain-containing protein [Kordiimonas sp. SCSIO 12603]
MHPYSNLPTEAFWRTAVASKNPLNIEGLWKPKFKILPDQQVLTAGSCFAQHIGKALSANGYNWHDGEIAPDFIDAETKHKYNYGIFSFRTGNIYTTSLLLQWLEWAVDPSKAPKECWKDANGRYYDPFRPNIEPNGFTSEEELIAARNATFTAIRKSLKTAKFFVFTLGLTEAWKNTEEGYFYPLCPGTLQGSFDKSKHVFVNLKYPEIHSSLVKAIELVKSINDDIKFILTVSPVPLTATAAEKHVLVSTTYSKSTLRAVAGDLADERDDVDYFPSYEIITGTPYKGMFYEPNQRSVANRGVAHVMEHFFADFDVPNAPKEHAQAETQTIQNDEDDIVCEEELLDAFSEKK